MSISRDAVAEICHVDEETVRCDHCLYCGEERITTVICNLWKMPASRGSFCQFFFVRDNENEEQR